MSVFLISMLKYVAPFLMGMVMAAAAVFGDVALISILLSAGFVWFFSMSMRTSEQAPG